jgi:hypothetical protein
VAAQAALADAQAAAERELYEEEERLKRIAEEELEAEA